VGTIVAAIRLKLVVDDEDAYYGPRLPQLFSRELLWDRYGERHGNLMFEALTWAPLL
jgi:hypothetical protein